MHGFYYEIKQEGVRYASTTVQSQKESKSSLPKDEVRKVRLKMSRLVHTKSASVLALRSGRSGNPRSHSYHHLQRYARHPRPCCPRRADLEEVLYSSTSCCVRLARWPRPRLPSVAPEAMLFTSASACSPVGRDEDYGPKGTTRPAVGDADASMKVRKSSVVAICKPRVLVVGVGGRLCR